MHFSFLTGIILAALFAVLGVFLVMRRMAFFGDGIAHMSLLGIALGVVMGVSPVLTAIVVSAVLALCIYLLEQKAKAPPDAVVGVFFTASMAAGALILSFAGTSDAEEFEGLLFGDIFSVQALDAAVAAALAVLLFCFFFFRFRRLALVMCAREFAYLAALPLARYEAGMYVAVAVATVLGVKLLGVILVSALLIIPVLIARIFARSLRGLFAGAVVAAESIVIIGLFLSKGLSVPSGAVIVLLGFVGILLALCLQWGISFLGTPKS